jgi:hypothetical protein
MVFAAFFLGTTLFFISMEMWSRAHPPDPVAGGLSASQRELPDRFIVADSGLEVAAVSRYLDFVAASGSHGGLIHNYVDRGLRLLTLSILGVSTLRLRVGTVDKMQRTLALYVDSLQSHPRWALDPERVRPAFLMAAEIMGSLNLPYDEEARTRIRKVDKAIQALEPGRSTLWQRSKIQDIFIFSAQALVKLKERSSPAYGAIAPPPP